MKAGARKPLESVGVEAAEGLGRLGKAEIQKNISRHLSVYLLQRCHSYHSTTNTDASL